jgi:nucleotide-binding universal stress UspA family protein
VASEFAAAFRRIARGTQGTEVGGFRIVEPLHAGGAGYVYRVEAVHETDRGRPLVMKVPAVGAGEPVIGLVGFEMEQMILPALRGPHVPRFVAAGDLLTAPFLVMEEVPGESLAVLAKRAPLAEPDVARVGAALADALQSLHEQQAVHQDLKPENVILRPDPANGAIGAGAVAVLIDFGFAFHARYPDLLAEERQHDAGSAPYVSPEQLRGIRGDPRSDLFSLGAMLYELATGCTPFGEPASRTGIRDRLWRAPIPPRARVPAVSAAMQEVILRCLEIDPRERYQGAAHVAFDLRNLAQVPLTARAARTEPPGFARQLLSWWRAREPMPAPGPDGPRLGRVILIAVDTTHMEDARHPRIQYIARQVMSVAVEHRVMCVSVLHAGAPGEGATLGESESGRQLEHLARLRRWVEPLGLAPERLSLHVLQAFDAAGAIVELARRNHADLIMLGAPGPSEKLLGWWRSVASSVTAGAHCSVYVVRIT